MEGKQSCLRTQNLSEEISMGKLTENIKGTINEVVGGIKQQSDKPEEKIEGKVQELKGKAQKVKGKIDGALGDDI
jgi:uncharacterized protein YjbJ (UPF0337 family)